MEKNKIAPLIILGSLAVGGMLIFALSQKAKAVPPGQWTCPYCQATFSSYEDLVAHVQSIHPGERIPLPIDWS
jgi:hypothetical protein